MGATVSCETNCKTFTLIPEKISKWQQDGKYQYRRGEARCDNCNSRLYLTQCKYNECMYEWKKFDYYRCECKKLIPDKDQITYHREGGVESLSNGFSLMFLAPFMQPSIYLKTKANCLHCGKIYTVTASCRTVIRNKEKVHIPTSKWERVKIKND